MKILLDENFPLALCYRLRTSGYDTDHVITLDQRGIPDSAIRIRLTREPLLFITQDIEFAYRAEAFKAAVLISCVPQSLPLPRRIEMWIAAIDGFFREKPAGQVFELLENGRLVPWNYMKPRI